MLSNPIVLMSKSILSVNGNKAMNFLLKTILEREYEFVPVGDAFQGMHQLKTNKSIRILLIDLDFQPQQGWEFIEHIKSSRLYSLPVVILATENTELLRQKCYDLEVDEIFFKPFNPVDLIAAIKSTISVTEMV
jgi:CheY-like chemotaxis protein